MTSACATQELTKAIDEIYRYPLQQVAADTLNRQLRTGTTDQQLADLVTALRGEGRLCRIEEGHAELDGPVDRGDGLTLVTFIGGAVGVAHSHETEAESRNREALRAELARG